MLVDNKNVDQYIGKNNIIGKYYKGNNLQIGTTTDKIKYDIYLNENKLEKKIIGEKKLKTKQRCIVSSLEIDKKLCLIANENINEINDLKSNNNEENIKKIINENINNEKLQSNLVNKIRKTSTNKVYNRHMMKLKHYCSNLIKIEKHQNDKNNKHNGSVCNLIFSPKNEKRRKNKNEKNNYKSGKEKPKFSFRRTEVHESGNMTSNILNSSNLKSKDPVIKNCHTELKSQTKIHQNSFKLAKSSFHLKNNKSSDKLEEEKSKSPKKNTLKKVSSSRRIINANNINNIINNDIHRGMTISKFYNPYQKSIINKKEKASDSSKIKKMLSDKNKDFAIVNKRKINNNNNQNHFISKLYNNLDKNTSNSNLFRGNNKTITKKLGFKKSLTIKNLYKFKAADILEKKNGTSNKLKNNKY